MQASMSPALPMTRKAGLHKWKECQGLPGTQRERCVLIPNVNVCLSNFSSDPPSDLLFALTILCLDTLIPDCSVSFANGVMENEPSNIPSPLSPTPCTWPPLWSQSASHQRNTTLQPLPLSYFTASRSDKQDLTCWRDDDFSIEMIAAPRTLCYSGLYILAFQYQTHGPSLKPIASEREIEQGLQLQTKENGFHFFPIFPPYAESSSDLHHRCPSTPSMPCPLSA